MRLFRICHQKRIKDYSGLGASYEDGARWNVVGQPVLYFAATPSVAMLEMANYLPSPHHIPPSYRLGIYALAKRVKTETWAVEDLPKNWRQFPYPKSTQSKGAEWLAAKKCGFLLVPSVAVPGGLENIVVVNPLHKDIQHLEHVGTEKQIFNARVFK